MKKPQVPEYSLAFFFFFLYDKFPVRSFREINFNVDQKAFSEWVTDPKNSLLKPMEGPRANPQTWKEGPEVVGCPGVPPYCHLSLPCPQAASLRVLSSLGLPRPQSL